MEKAFCKNNSSSRALSCTNDFLYEDAKGDKDGEIWKITYEVGPESVVQGYLTGQLADSQIFE